MKHFTLTKKAWVGPNGETTKVLKDEEMGIMISAFQSHKFRYGLELNDKQLARVNEFHEGKKYLDEKAATTKKNTAAKKPLTLSPFVLEFEYSASEEGYWSYQHMVLQVEDCVNVLKTIYPQYDFLFFFNYSCEHDK